MQRIIILLLFFTFYGLAQTKYFLPINVQQSNGRPINNANVDLYTTGTSTKVYDLIYQANSPGNYYNTTSFTQGVYDLYVNGSVVMTGVSLGGDISTQEVINIITEFVDTLRISSFLNVLDMGADSTGATSSSQAFQDAIDSVVAGGYAGIIVPAGTYAVKNVRIDYNSQTEGIIILGNGALIQTANASNPSTVSRYEAVEAIFHIWGADADNPLEGGITISGLTFAGTRTSFVESSASETADILNFAHVNQISIQNCGFRNTRRSGIKLRNCLNVEVTNNSFRNIAGAAVVPLGGFNITVSQDSFYTVANAMRVYPDTASGNPPRNIFFEKNWVRAHRDGVLTWMMDNLTISDNTFIPVDATGFLGDSCSAVEVVANFTEEGASVGLLAKNITIARNIFQGYDDEAPSQKDGVILFEENGASGDQIGRNNQIQDNLFDDCEKSIYLEFEADIVGNEIRNVPGFYVNYITTAPQHTSDIGTSILIAYNKIFGITTSDYGISAQGDAYYRIVLNTLNTCTIQWAPDVGYEAIIEGNILTSSGSMYIGGDNGTIKGNNITTSANHAIQGVSGGNTNHIIGNTILMGSAFAGINLPQGCSNTIVCGNHINGGPDYGVEIINSSNHKVCHNTIEGASARGILVDESGGGSADNNLLFSNLLEGNTAGILLDPSASGNVDTLNVVIP